MTNNEKFIEVFGEELQRQYVTKSWWEQEYVPPIIIDLEIFDPHLEQETKSECEHDYELLKAYADGQESIARILAQRENKIAELRKEVMRLRHMVDVLTKTVREISEEVVSVSTEKEG